MELSHARVNHHDQAKELGRRKAALGAAADVLHIEIRRTIKQQALNERLKKLRAALLKEFQRLDDEIGELTKGKEKADA